jgi:hypothetical protein
MANLMQPAHDPFRHRCLIERQLPENHTGVIPVPANQHARIPLACCHKLLSADKLPARDAVHHHDTQLVTRVQEIR